MKTNLEVLDETHLTLNTVKNPLFFLEDLISYCSFVQNPSFNLLILQAVLYSFCGQDVSVNGTGLKFYPAKKRIIIFFPGWFFEWYFRQKSV